MQSPRSLLDLRVHLTAEPLGTGVAAAQQRLRNMVLDTLFRTASAATTPRPSTISSSSRPATPLPGSFRWSTAPRSRTVRFHDQRSALWTQEYGVRSAEKRNALGRGRGKPYIDSEHPPEGNPPWKLAYERTSKGASYPPGPIDPQWEARLCHPALLVDRACADRSSHRSTSKPSSCREGRWVLADFEGKRRTRTVVTSVWVKHRINAWISAARIEEGPLMRSTAEGGRVGKSLRDWAVWLVCSTGCQTDQDRAIRAHDLRRTRAKLRRKSGGNLEQTKFLLVRSSIQTTERCVGSQQEIVIAVNDSLDFSQTPSSGESVQVRVA